MQIKSKALLFKLKIGAVVSLLVLAVGSFLAANPGNEMQVNVGGSGNISVEFKDADVQDVFRVLAMKGNVSIVTDPDVKGLVTVHITDVPWEKVLDVICKTYSYAYEREGNIIRVTTLEKLSQESLVTEVFSLNYAKAKSVADSVTEMKSDRGKIKYDDRANLVIVTDIPTNIYKIGKVINKLDAITPQVTIEAKIIETTLNNEDDLGFKWNAQASASMAKRPTTFPWDKNKSYGEPGKYLPLGDDSTTFHSTTTPAFPLATSTDFAFGVLDGSSFSILMQAISSRGKTKILSNPRITTMDNQPAKIHVGTDWPIANYSYNEQTDRFVITGWEYKSYGILLEVTPTINSDGYITLKLHPEVSDRQSTISFQGADVPVLATQTTEATVMIKDGETLVVGGLLKDKVVTTKTKVPILGDIPILSLFFSHKVDTVEKRDLLIFITPHVVSSQKLTKQQVTKLLEANAETDKGEAEVKLKKIMEQKSSSVSSEKEVKKESPAKLQVKKEIKTVVSEDMAAPGAVKPETAKPAAQKAGQTKAVEAKKEEPIKK